MKRVTVTLAIAAFAAGIASYQLWSQWRFVAGRVPLRPIVASEITAHVQKLAAIDPGPLAEQLSADANIRAFAAQATAGQSEPEAQARAIVAELQKRATAGAFGDWARVEPRVTPPLTAAGTLAALNERKPGAQLYPFELASLAVAALRSLEVPALLAEVYRYPDERTALDPSGRLGYHAVFLGDGATKSGRVFDPFGGRSVQPSQADFAVLNDTQAVAAALNLRALTRFDVSRDPPGSLVDVTAAEQLSSSSPSVRCARALVLLGNPANSEEGVRELDKALAQHGDAPRHANWAMHALAQQELTSASMHIQAALAEAPDYALAHVFLSSLHLMRGEYDPATRELDQAEKLAPDLALVPQIRAQLQAAIGELEIAAASAQKAVQQRPHDPQPLFILARIERNAGRGSDMRKHVQALLDLVPEIERDRRRQQLQNVFGDDVFEPGPGATREGPARAAAP
jgi:tetratricopeptide (TPR) repeat protein